MAISGTQVWNVQPGTGSDYNGGGFRKLASARTDDGGAFLLSPEAAGRSYSNRLIFVRDDKGRVAGLAQDD